MYGVLSHIINIYNELYNGTILPEIMIYGINQTYPKENDYRGIYHITSVESGSHDLVIIYLYEKTIDNALYHDYIPSTSHQMTGNWFMHFPWPTHKALLIYLSSGNLFRAYIDSDVDTIFDAGDKILTYQPIARNISMANNKMIKNWNEFEYLKKENESTYPINILEMFGKIPGAIPGSYFPIKCINNR
jgi:hypothetical protein